MFWMRRYGRKNFRMSGSRLGEVERGDALEGKYDLVVSTMTFHHIRDVGVLLDRLSGVLDVRGMACGC